MKNTMKNKTLKTKLKAKNIIILERNGIDFPITYGKMIELLNNNTNIGDLKISEALDILSICSPSSRDLDEIYNIFADTEAELLQKNADLQAYIDSNFTKI